MSILDLNKHICNVLQNNLQASSRIAKIHKIRTICTHLHWLGKRMQLYCIFVPTKSHDKWVVFDLILRKEGLDFGYHQHRLLYGVLQRSDQHHVAAVRLVSSCECSSNLRHSRAYIGRKMNFSPSSGGLLLGKLAFTAATTSFRRTLWIVWVIAIRACAFNLLATSILIIVRTVVVSSCFTALDLFFTFPNISAISWFASMLQYFLSNNLSRSWNSLCARHSVAMGFKYWKATYIFSVMVIF